MLDSALVLAPGQELMLFSSELKSWGNMSGDYEKTWLDKMSQHLEQGNSITVIHAINQGPRMIVADIARFLPLHMSGKTKALCYPYFYGSYGLSLRYSIALLKGHSVLAGVHVDGNNDEITTIYSTNPVVVRQFENIYEWLMSRSATLYDVFQPMDLLVRWRPR